MTITFAYPYWLVAGVLGSLLLAFFLRKAVEYKKQQLQRFAAPMLLSQLLCNFSPQKIRLQNICLISSIFLCFVALARPQFGYRWVEVKQKGVDLVFAVDTSKSMLAEDIKPNRLERAKLAIYDFISRLPGNRVGLMPFAGTPWFMCPLTTDYEIFYQNVNSLDTAIIPQGGTNIAGVIDLADEVLQHNKNNYKILIILTDGENLGGGIAEATARAKENGLAIYTIGVGTEEGELIPLEGGGFVKDRSGQLVQSKLNTKVLRQIAEDCGGLYAPLGKMGEGLETIYQQRLAQKRSAKKAQKNSQRLFSMAAGRGVVFLSAGDGDGKWDKW